jgi:hypothetical protein
MADESQSDRMATDEAAESSGISFAAFVLSLAHTTAVHLGDVPDPISGKKAETNLPAAQQMIEILGLLDEKTRGNLTAEERQLLEQILYELRLRYLEVKKAAGAGPSPSRIIIP